MLRSRVVATGLVALVAAGAAPAKPPQRVIVVDTAQELEDALVPANAGVLIHVVAGTYLVDSALTAPEDATLEGEGVMLGSDLPTGFAAGTDTRIVPRASLTGDILTLKDGVAVRGLAIEDVAGREGNAVAVLSGEPGDTVAASLHESEIVTPNPVGITRSGPIGSGIVAITQNPELGADPPPHVDATIELELHRSIVHAADHAFFLANFAEGGRVTATLTANRITGQLEAVAGISRPDAVEHATVDVESRSNIYATPPGGGAGWQLGGGFTTPIQLGGFPWLGASHNTLRMDSRDDRIEGARTGIVATAARRNSSTAGMSSSNEIHLTVDGLRLQTMDAGAADLDFAATHSVAGQAFGDFKTGDDNVLNVKMRGTTGSGLRANRYAHELGPSAANSGTGNRLRFVGSPVSFGRLNDDIDPAPPAAFFGGGA